MTHTYRLGAQLQAMAIDAVDLNRFGTHRVPSPQPEITALCRHRIINDRRTVLVVPRDAADRLVAAVTAATPVDGGVIDSHITNFCSGQLIWTRAITPPAHWWSRQPADIARNRYFSLVTSASRSVNLDAVTQTQLNAVARRSTGGLDRRSAGGQHQQRSTKPLR